MQVPVQPIEYATGPRRHERPFTVVDMTFWLGALSVAALCLMCFVFPRFDVVFSDFSTVLPWSTALFLRLSRFCRHDFGWIILVLLPALPMAIDRLNNRRWAREGVPQRTRILFGLLILMGILILVGAVGSMFLAMISPGGGISSPNPRRPGAIHLESIGVKRRWRFGLRELCQMFNV